MVIIDKFINIPVLIAQIINLAILVYILNRFIFKPVFVLIDKRKKEVEEAIHAAKSAKEHAQQAEEDVAHTLKKANEKANQLIDAAKQSAIIMTEKNIKDTEARAMNIIKSAEISTQQKEAELMKKITDYIVKVSVLVANKTLKKSLDDTAQKALVEEVVKSL
jgi:F-type H+-transporting ATPase subunit b